MFNCIAMQARAAAPASQPVWNADTFTIGFWCGPPAKFTTLERYQEIKDAGFTVVFPPNTGVTVDLNKKILGYCEQLGLKAFVTDSRIPAGLENDAKVKAGIDAAVADYAKYPALAGYFIADEPGPGAYPSLGRVVQYLREKDPKHFAYINLLPLYAPEWAIGKSYEQYVRGFVDIVKPPLISYDNYGFATGDPNPLLSNLAIVRKVSLESGVPFWNIVLATQHGPYHNLTEGELRFEAMNTIAYGAKGLMWFTYWSPADSDKSFDWKHALINEDGSRDPHYEMVKRVNAEAQAIGSQLLKAQSVEVLSAKDKKSGAVKVAGDALVATFRTSDSKSIAMVVNPSWEKPLTTTATLGVADEKPEVFDVASGKWSRASSDSIPIQLEPGGAMLIRY